MKYGRPIKRTKDCRKGNNVGLVYMKTGSRSAFLRNVRECLSLIQEYNDAGVMPGIEELVEGLGRCESTIMMYLKECRLDKAIESMRDKRWGQVYRVTKGASDDNTVREVPAEVF